jgi:ubiquinone/menaquinone biosynthesis C-methylase UbiE
MLNDEEGASRPIEHWPVSEYTSQRQIEGWSVDEENAELNNTDEQSRLEFLKFKNEHLGRENSDYYFKKLGVPIRGKVLEQGAGIFWLSSYLSSFDAVEEVVGIELSEERIKAFRDLSLSLFKNSNPNKIRYVVGDMHRIDVPDNTFDLIVCDAVLHHADNLVAMLRESWRALKPGGWFVALREPTIPHLRASDPVFHSRYPEDGTAYYYYKSGWKSAFLNGWFVNIRMTPFVEYGFVRGKRMPWLARRLFRFVDARRHVYPKLCIAGQKPV